MSRGIASTRWSVWGASDARPRALDLASRTGVPLLATLGERRARLDALMAWRDSDELLLQRLEDETIVEALFASRVGVEPSRTPGCLHPRAGGLVAELRKLPAGAEAVTAAAAGDVVRLARFIDDLELREAPPELLHHLALFHRTAATALEQEAPESAANAWVRSLAAWLALAEERLYLARLGELVIGGDAAQKKRAADAGIPPERVPLELVADVAKRAESTASDLGPPGRAALLALARTDEAARIAGASPEATRRARAEAERRRNAAIEAALAVIGEGLDEANVRGELATSGRTLLLRAVSVWTWTSNDEAVEHFVVDRVDKIGWELYRARSWDALRYLLDPFRPMFESLASRIERDPSRIAYAAACAQMFVFLAEVDRYLPRKLEMAERAVKICPTHRNGRLVLASVLCDQAMEAMRAMVVFARRDELERVEVLLERAESLYPQTNELPEARSMLVRVKKGRIAVLTSSVERGVAAEGERRYSIVGEQSVRALRPRPSRGHRCHHAAIEGARGGGERRRRARADPRGVGGAHAPSGAAAQGRALRAPGDARAARDPAVLPAPSRGVCRSGGVRARAPRSRGAAERAPCPRRLRGEGRRRGPALRGRPCASRPALT